MNAAAGLTLFTALLFDVSPPSRGLDPQRLGLERVLAPLGGQLAGLSFSPDGRRLALGCSKGVLIYDTRRWTLDATLEGLESVILSVAWSPDGSLLAGGAFDGKILIWRAASGVRERICAGHGAHVSGLEWSRDGTRLLSGSLDGTARLWDARSGAELRQLGTPEASLLALRFEDGDRKVRAALGNNTVRLWEAGTGRELAVLAGAPGLISAAAFSSDGDFACGNGAGDLRVRRLEAAAAERVFPAEEGGAALGRLVFTPDSRHLIGVTHAGGVRIWETRSGELRSALTPGPGVLESVALDPGGRCFVTVGQDRLLRVWAPRAGDQARVQPRGFFGIRVDLAAEGRVLVSEVLAGTPAAAAGLRVGDRLRAIDGVPVVQALHVVDLIGRHFADEELHVSLERDGGVLEVRIKLAKRTEEQN